MPLLAAVAIAVAVIAAVAGVATVLVLRSGSGPSGAAGEALSYGTARALSDSAAAGVREGPWTLFGAKAYDLNRSAPFGPAFTFGLSGPIQQVLSPARPPVPALTGPLSSGLSPWWMFLYDNGTTNPSYPNESSVLAVVVVNGSALPLAIFLSSLGIPAPVPGTGLLDTPAVMPAALESNVSFVDAHPGLNATLILAHGSVPPWIWAVSFTTCSPFANVTGPGGSTSNCNAQSLCYNVQVNATSGSVVGKPFPPYTCA